MAVNRRDVLAEGHTATRARWPDVSPSDVVLAYDADPLDTLFVHLHGDPLPGYYVPVELDEPRTDGLLVKVSMDRVSVIGFMIEGYLAWADRRPPNWLEVAPFAGVPPSAQTDEDRMAALLAGREAAVAGLLSEVEAAWSSVQDRRG